MTPTPSFALPGQRLAALQPSMRAGSGTYVRDGAVYASIAGQWSIDSNEVRVTRVSKPIGSSQVLRLGDVVVCKITKVSTRQVLVDILCVRNTVLQESFPGTIRLEDVRNHDIDKLVLEDLFSPGMLVKAAVLSFGDTRSYFLSTAKAGLGIIRSAPQNADDGDVDMS
ncbi:hypothetical protein ATCC90586_005672 [Pythium insidiosum]|nr:hypothetical protein ATCC90586_005672 [Pythium insidiosum]